MKWWELQKRPVCALIGGPTNSLLVTPGYPATHCLWPQVTQHHFKRGSWQLLLRGEKPSQKANPKPLQPPDLRRRWSHLKITAPRRHHHWVVPEGRQYPARTSLTLGTNTSPTSTTSPTNMTGGSTTPPAMLIPGSRSITYSGFSYDLLGARF